jgi:hypothetical protein
MRRVVGDQLKALSELSEIIGRHGKSFDVSTPALGEVRAAVGDTFLSGPTMREPVRETPRFEPPRAIGNGTALPPAAKAAPPRATPRPAPTPLRSTDSGSEGGWVSDLLRRASTDDELPAAVTERRPEAPAATASNGNGNGHGNGNGNSHAGAAPVANGTAAASAAGAPASGALGAISADIARAIDHDAAVELWARHHRGEKNLFTRRLYTMSGQQTFDEIRRKYQRESDFKTAVDRYVADFEKLLAEVTKSGKDRTASTAYLTSDTGKVYTMLAHASGRFD